VLGHHWEPGEATIIAAEEEHDFSRWPDDASARTYVVDVRPAAGTSAFRTQVRRSYRYRDAMTPERGLRAGEVIAVSCDPKHQKAKFDESDPRLYKDGQVPGKGHRSPSPSEVAFEAAAAAPPGTPASTAPSEFVEALGASAFVVTEGGLAPVGPTPGGRQTDVVDQLTKLAGLRDSGVLTEAEFEAEKQKLLDAKP
jgi:Short C-terminal domain